MFKYWVLLFLTLSVFPNSGDCKVFKGPVPLPMGGAVIISSGARAAIIGDKETPKPNGTPLVVRGQKLDKFSSEEVERLIAEKVIIPAKAARMCRQYGFKSLVDVSYEESDDTQQNTILDVAETADGKVVETTTQTLALFRPYEFKYLQSSLSSPSLWAMRAYMGWYSVWASLLVWQLTGLASVEFIPEVLRIESLNPWTEPLRAFEFVGGLFTTIRLKRYLDSGKEDFDRALDDIMKRDVVYTKHIDPHCPCHKCAHFSIKTDHTREKVPHFKVKKIVCSGDTDDLISYAWFKNRGKKYGGPSNDGKANTASANDETGSAERIGDTLGGADGQNKNNVQGDGSPSKQDPANISSLDDFDSKETRLSKGKAKTKGIPNRHLKSDQMNPSQTPHLDKKGIPPNPLSNQRVSHETREFFSDLFYGNMKSLNRKELIEAFTEINVNVRAENEKVLIYGSHEASEGKTPHVHTIHASGFGEVRKDLVGLVKKFVEDDPGIMNKIAELDIDE